MILDLSESIMWLFLWQWCDIADVMFSCSAFSLSVFVSRPVVSFSHSLWCSLFLTLNVLSVSSMYVFWHDLHSISYITLRIFFVQFSFVFGVHSLLQWPLGSRRTAEKDTSAIVRSHFWRRLQCPTEISCLVSDKKKTVQTTKRITKRTYLSEYICCFFTLKSVSGVGVHWVGFFMPVELQSGYVD